METSPDAATAGRSRRGLVERYIDSVTDRLGANSFTGKMLRKVFPNHFSFLWGEVALYCFVVLLITGTYLTFFFEGSQQRLVYHGSYRPLQGAEVSAAYDSVMRISFDVKGGLLIRQMHHWAALVFIGAIALHMARIFFTGAFRRPREINWVVGVLLLILALAAGFTGYSLPDDLLSGSGLRITQAIILAIPFIGERLSYLIFGGDWPGTDIIGRLYPVHILLIPAAIVAVLGVHLALVWHQKHTQFRGPGRTEHNVIGLRVWPGFAIKSIGLMFLVAGVITAMGALFHVNAIWLYGPYDVGRGDVVLAARLVHRLPRGLAAPDAAVGDPHRQLHDQQPRVLGDDRARASSSPGCSWCPGSSATSRRTTASTTSSTGPATRPTARPPASPRRRSSPCCSSAARRTSSPATLRTVDRPRHDRAADLGDRRAADRLLRDVPDLPGAADPAGPRSHRAGRR